MSSKCPDFTRDSGVLRHPLQPGDFDSGDTGISKISSVNWGLDSCRS